MIRGALQKRQHEPGFRWRGGEIARIEGLSDAVFAFAVTLLVVSLEVPKTFSELSELMHGFIPFAISFALLMQIWHEQYRYFRRYNLQDWTTTLLNMLLLFMVLFFVYPLKFLWGFLVTVWAGGGRIPHVEVNGKLEQVIEAHQVPQLMAIFSSGYLAVSLVFILLFLHAFRKKDTLELNPLEIHLTRVSMGVSIIQGVVAGFSLLIAFFGGERFGASSGIVYPFLLGPSMTIYYTIMSRKGRQIQGRMAQETEQAKAD